MVGEEPVLESKGSVSGQQCWQGQQGVLTGIVYVGVILWLWRLRGNKTSLCKRQSFYYKNEKFDT